MPTMLVDGSQYSQASEHHQIIVCFCMYYAHNEIQTPIFCYTLVNSTFPGFVHTRIAIEQVLYARRKVMTN